MGLFGSSDPAAKHEKLLQKEAKHEEKSLKQAIKEVSKAEKEEHKAAKAETKTHHSVEKAAKVEQKLASKLNSVTHKHDSAASKQLAAENELRAKEDAHHRAAAALEQKKAQLDNLQKNHSTNEAVRAEKLHELRPDDNHNPTLAGATAAGGLDKHYANQGYGSTNTAGTVPQANAPVAPVAGATSVGGVGQPGYNNDQQIGTVPGSGAGYDTTAGSVQPGYSAGTGPDGQPVTEAVHRI